MENKQKKILVLGGTGAMGVYLVPELLRMGYLVDVVSLDDVKSDNPALTYRVGNARDENVIRPILEEGHYDGIVDFMIYSTELFSKRYQLLLDNTKHYIYLSSYRVYADEQHPITESAPRLLDVSKDEEMLATDTYALAKARQEDILSASSYRNWTAIRPAITFSKRRYQLVTMEANTVVVRARAGKPLILPAPARYVQATMTWAGDMAKMISRLLFNDAAYGERITVSTSEHRTWDEIASYYKELIGLEVMWIDEMDYLRIVNPDHPMRDARWQLEYDRMYDRIVDNSKVMRICGMKQSDLTPIHDALAAEFAVLPADATFPPDKGLNDRMDAYLAAHKG